MKYFMNKKDRKIIEKAMPATLRKEYKGGMPITVTIERRKSLKRYGKIIVFNIGKCGKIYSCNLDEDMLNIAENIIGYFLYGEINAEFSIRF